MKLLVIIASIMVLTQSYRFRGADGTLAAGTAETADVVSGDGSEEGGDFVMPPWADANQLSDQSDFNHAEHWNDTLQNACGGPQDCDVVANQSRCLAQCHCLGPEGNCSADEEHMCVAHCSRCAICLYAVQASVGVMKACAEHELSQVDCLEHVGRPVMADFVVNVSRELNGARDRIMGNLTVKAGEVCGQDGTPEDCPQMAELAQVGTHYALRVNQSVNALEAHLGKMLDAVEKNATNSTVEVPEGAEAMSFLKQDAEVVSGDDGNMDGGSDAGNGGPDAGNGGPDAGNGGPDAGMNGGPNAGMTGGPNAGGSSAGGMGPGPHGPPPNVSGMENVTDVSGMENPGMGGGHGPNHDGTNVSGMENPTDVSGMENPGMGGGHGPNHDGTNVSGLENPGMGGGHGPNDAGAPTHTDGASGPNTAGGSHEAAVESGDQNGGMGGSEGHEGNPGGHDGTHGGDQGGSGGPDMGGSDGNTAGGPDMGGSGGPDMGGSDGNTAGGSDMGGSGGPDMGGSDGGSTD